MRVLITGAAGFIGSTLAHRLMARGDEVIGVDNLILGARDSRQHVGDVLRWVIQIPVVNQLQ